MIYVFLANGFEEIEALAVVDVLRRAELDVLTVGIGEDFVIGSHQIPVAADISEKGLVLNDKVEAIVLPGGMPGTLNLGAHEGVKEELAKAFAAGKFLAAICAAPSVLGKYGMLKGRKATSYPGFEDALEGATYVYEEVAVDDFVITSRGMGTAIAFSLTLVEKLVDAKKAEELGKSIIYQCS